MDISSFNGNWFDLAILLIVFYFIYQAIRVGFWSILFDFFSFLLALFVSLAGFKYAAVLLRNNFSVPHTFSNALGFLFTAVLIEGLLGILFTHLLAKIPKKYQKFRLGKIAALPFAMGEAIILISFIVMLIVGLPVSPQVKSDIVDSQLGKVFVEKTGVLEAKITEIFGGVIEDSLTYLTVKPGSTQAIPITIDTQNLTVDEKSEEELFNLVNKERLERGLEALSWNPETVLVARAHARDMWMRKYFGHYSPEGDDVGDRLDKGGVEYGFAGENLALAPTVSTAHMGLMNSERHRANILEENFIKIGIGVIDAGIYGKMFVQVFN